MTHAAARQNLGGLIYFALAFTLGAYFTFAAVQGDYGVFRRVEISAEAEALRAVRGTRSIYHNNAIQSWKIAESGEVSNVQVY